MPIELRLAVPLALALAAAGCEMGSGGQGASGGQGGLRLSFGSVDSRDCSMASAGEGGAGFLVADGGAPAACSESMPIDYPTQVAPILGTCGGEVCHQFAGPDGIATFIAAPSNECCNQRQLIAPGHPGRSYLVDKLRGQRLCYGKRMPENRGALADADVAVIQAWICQGALLP